MDDKHRLSGYPEHTPPAPEPEPAQEPAAPAEPADAERSGFADAFRRKGKKG